MEQASYDAQATFAVARVRVKPGWTAVAVGITDARPDSERLPAWLMQAMHEAVVRRGVRVLTGVFGRSRSQMSELAQNLPLATAQPVMQEWQSPAVAGATSVFPSYTLLIGTCSNITTPPYEALPPASLPLQERWCSAVAEYEDVVPAWYQWTRQQIAWCKVDDMDWGHVKVKRVDSARWIPGCHQVAWWCGTAQTGRGAAGRKLAKSSAKAKKPQSR